MRPFATQLPLLLLAGAPSLVAAASWGFSDATISVQSKGAGVGGGLKEKWEFFLQSGGATLANYIRLSENEPMSQALQLGTSDTLKIILTTQEDKSAQRPHQAFLNIRDSASGLETSFAFAVKESGKGKIELVSKPTCSFSDDAESF